MKIKKITIIIFLLHLLGLGIFFAVKSVEKSKKTVSVDSLETSNQQLVNSIQEKELIDNQQPAVSDHENKEISNQQPATDEQTKGTLPSVANKTDNKEIVEPKKSNPAVEEKIKSDAGKFVQKNVSWGFQKSTGRIIKAIIVHTSYNNLGGDRFDFDKVIQEWKDAGVAPHYAIDRDGTIYQLVSDQNIAWHAGVSKLPDGTTDVNGASIGIELINSQDAKFTAEQYSALNSLIATLKKKYSIKYILGHDEIAPGRKTDPWGIDWRKVSK